VLDGYGLAKIAMDKIVMQTARPEPANLRLHSIPTIVEHVSVGVTAMFALIHLLLAASLVAILAYASGAHAADDAACGARDLIAELKLKDPAAYEKLRADGEKIKNSDARFWKLEKSGQAPDWLLGTMHVTDERVTTLPDQAERAFRASDTLIVESDEILDQKKASAKLMAEPGLMMFAGKETLKDYLTPDQQKLVEDGLMKRGIPFLSVIKMKPYILSSVVTLSSCEMSRKAHGVAFLDMKLALEAQATGKEVRGVETLAEQLRAMSDLPMSFHVRSLVESLRYPDYTANMMETMADLYVSGNLGMFFPASVYFAPEKNPADVKDMNDFENKMLNTRNHHMADRGAPILAKGNVFMAVGALHLIGDEGLVELFRKQGYAVSAVK
jgi:hypothetical protein